MYMNKYKIYKEVHEEIKARAYEMGLRTGRPDNWKEAEDGVRERYEQEELQDMIHRGECGK